MNADQVADAIDRNLSSPNVSDRNGEDANIVDAVSDLAAAARKIANAITPGDALPGHDEHGGRVDSLTEAAMGITKSLSAIAAAIDRLAEAVEGHG